jgi:hypothetical protein
VVEEEATTAPTSSPSCLKVAHGDTSIVSLGKDEISAFVTLTQGVLNDGNFGVILQDGIVLRTGCQALRRARRQ